MNARWAIGYVMGAAFLLGAASQLPAPRWWRRWDLRRELRSMAAYRGRIRRHVGEVERALRAGHHPSVDRDQLGRELAALAVLMVDADDRIDHLLDQLTDLR